MERSTGTGQALETSSGTKLLSREKETGLMWSNTLEVSLSLERSGEQHIRTTSAASTLLVKEKAKLMIKYGAEKICDKIPGPLPRSRI